MKTITNFILFALIIFYLTSCKQNITKPLENQKQDDSTITQDDSTKTNFLDKFVFIQAGSFLMGNKNLSTDSDADSDEVPFEKFVDNYYISKTEVTFDDYDLYTKDVGLSLVKSTWRGQPQGRGSRPVVNISWFDAIKYANWLSKKNGLPVAYDEKTGNLLDLNGKITINVSNVKGFRLPTEAEWEFAARERGKDIKYAWGNDLPLQNGKPMANVPDESLKKNSDCKAILENYDDGFAEPAPVGTYIPNSLGLYDMTGNVNEWCNDIYDSHIGESISIDTRVIRGGSCDLSYRYLRIQERNYSKNYVKFSDLGFRLALSK